jgi:AraC-like DNA-binding protein
MIELFKILNLIAIIQGIAQGVILHVIRKNRFANRILAYIMILFAVSNLHWHFYFTGNEAASYYLSHLNLSLYLVFGPLVYFYILSITGKLKSISLKMALHFIPAVVVFILTIAFIYNRKPGSLDSIGGDDLVRLALFACIFLTTQIIYFINSVIILRRYGKAVRDLFSSFTGWKVNIVFIILLTAHIILVWIIILWGMAIADQTGSTPGSIAFLGYYIQYLFLTFGATYCSIRYLEVFKREEEAGTKKSYESFNIDAAKLDEYKQRILACMEQDRPYLNDMLTLKDFAGRLNIPPHLVSMTLNSCLNQNFFNFINQYRVEEVKRMLDDAEYDGHTLLRVAFAAGFNSKTTFNTMFKKFTGKTPTQFRKK